MTLNLEGLIPATVLPMHADGSIDEAGLRTYIRWVVDQGPVALAINVDTGEGPHLTHDEKIRVLEVVDETTDIPDRRRRGRTVDRGAVRQAREFKASRRRRVLGLPDPRLPERAARPAGARRLPRGDRRGRAAR